MKLMNGGSFLKRYRWLIFGTVLVLGAGLLTAIYLQQTNTPATKKPEKAVTIAEDKAKPQPVSPSLSFAAMGDMLAHDSVVNQARTSEGYDFTPYFSNIKSLYQGSDVTFCNPETPAAGSKYGISGYPTFNAPMEFSRDLSKSGCNLINFATNHIADKGQSAINDTLTYWQELEPLAIAGANQSLEEQQAVRYFEKNGLKVAFVAFADFSNSPAPNSYSLNYYHDQTLVSNLLTEARQQADVVIVSAHWGVEDDHTVSQDQQRTAQMLADLGADVIIGTGPHVLQKVSKLVRADGGETLVWYSIGNMLSSQLKVDELTGGIAKFRITKEADGLQISDIGFSSTFMSYEWSEADRLADNLLARRNLKLSPLKDAHQETALFGLTVQERLDKVRSWLGDEVPIT